MTDCKSTVVLPRRRDGVTDGSDRRVVVAECRYPDGIAVDVAAGHSYWARMSIPTTLWDVFDSFVEAAKPLELSVALDYSVDMGSLINEKRLQRITHRVEDARQTGATMLAGGFQRNCKLGPSHAVRYRLHEPTAHFERQTQLGDIPWTRE